MIIIELMIFFSIDVNFSSVFTQYGALFAVIDAIEFLTKHITRFFKGNYNERENDYFVGPHRAERVLSGLVHQGWYR